jgi:hypothetical protein
LTGIGLGLLQIDGAVQLAEQAQDLALRAEDSRALTRDAEFQGALGVTTTAVGAALALAGVVVIVVDGVIE